MKIVVIGNGFDIMHHMKTKYSDFLNYLHENKFYHGKNIFAEYLFRVNESETWLDLENELKSFLEQLCRFVNMLQYDSSTRNPGVYEGGYYINRHEFVFSTSTYCFYETIKNMDYDFFQVSETNASIGINDKYLIGRCFWTNELIKKVTQDYEEIVTELRVYLLKIQKNSDAQALTGNHKSILEDADYLYSFNYTNTATRYTRKRVHYVHGSLENDIILGIPYSSAINITDLQRYFKIVQSSKLGYNVRINTRSEKLIKVDFLGFSFGASDHYFFNEIKDLIFTQLKGPSNATDHVQFNFFHS